MLINIANTTIDQHEVVLISPFEPPLYMGGGSSHWIQEQERLGSSGVQAFGVQFAKGDFIVALSDDVELIRHGWDREVRRNFEQRDRGVGPFCLGLRLDEGGVNVMFGKAYASLPMMHRDDVRKHGWYDPIFFSRYGDNDLGLRIWKAGGRVEWTKEAIVRVHPDNARNGMTIREDDRTKFLQRWQHQFPDWPNDPAKYDCGIDMDKIGYFEGYTANYPTYQSYHEARRLAGHRGYDGTVAADGKIF